jgi:type I restriction enzyme S subunit
LDEKLEINQKFMGKLMQFGLACMNNYLIDFSIAEPLVNHVKFIKGFEPGSNAYISKATKECMPFIRGKTLESRTYDTFINVENLKSIASVNDVLIALDGAVGRTACGLSGAYSSGIRKAINNSRLNLSNGFIYFYLNSTYVQNIIDAFSQGRTTIPHAGRAIDKMELPICTGFDTLNDKLSTLFTKIVSTYTEVDILNMLKKQYLKKFFG